MKVGKILKEKYGFDDIKTIISFKCKYNYSGKFIQSLLDDEFPELLPVHLEEISEFTGIPVEELMKLQTPRPEGGIGHPTTPLGRLWVSYPVMAKLEIKNIEECLTSPLKPTIESLNEKLNGDSEITVTTGYEHSQSLSAEEKTVTISVDLLQRLVDAAYDFHPKNPAADEGQEILNKLEGEKS